MDETAEQTEKAAEPATAEEADHGTEALKQLQEYQPEKPASPRRDVLNDRYVIALGKPLPVFSNALTQGYEVSDEKGTDRELYALICSPHYSMRGKAIAALTEFSHPNFAGVLAAGTVELSTGDTRFALICDRPKGQTLSALLAAQTKPLQERMIADQILAPLIDLVSQFADMGFAHGRINLDTVYFGDKAMLVECASEPCGYSQPALYESPDRISCHAIGKGEGDGYTDCYAIGILALHLLLGPQHFAGMDTERTVCNIMNQGVYNTLIGTRDFPDYIRDLLRGCLSDNRRERWGIAQLKNWADGKRFNMLPPSLPKDAQRDYEFAGGAYITMRALAHAYHMQWEEAKIDLKDTRLLKWMELSVHRKETAEQIQKILRTLGGDAARSEKQANELVARIITVLEPFGPIRLKNTVCEIDGLGALVAQHYHDAKAQELQPVADIIEADLPNFLADMQKVQHTREVQDTLFKLQRVRLTMRSNHLGGGMERVLYDLNPHLACQSPLVIRHCVTGAGALLKTLDRLARERGKDSSPVDRHIAAFLCSKLDINKEFKVTELAGIPALATNPELITLKLLSQAQDRESKLIVPGLSAWMALRLQPVIELLHHRPLRKQVRKALNQAAREGKLSAMLKIFISPEVTLQDHNGFLQATQRYHKNAEAIARLKNNSVVMQQARITGVRIAMTLAYAGCIGVLHHTIGNYLGW